MSDDLDGLMWMVLILVILLWLFFLGLFILHHEDRLDDACKAVGFEGGQTGGFFRDDYCYGGGVAVKVKYVDGVLYLMTGYDSYDDCDVLLREVGLKQDGNYWQCGRVREVFDG